MPMNSPFRPSFLIASTLWLSACSLHLPSVQQGTPAESESPSIFQHDAANAVAWQATSTEYRWIALQTFAAATAALEEGLADAGWDALPPTERDTPFDGLPPTVIVDVDETVLDNRAFQVRNVIEHRGFDANAWSAWVRAAQAPAVPGAVAFAQAAAARGISIHYITNRGVELTDATLANLRAVGFPVTDARFILGRGTAVPDCEEGSGKHCRRKWVGRNHRVLLMIGDQAGDLIQDADAEAFARDDQQRAWLGQRWFLLPNPIYGRWESDLFDSDWSLDEAARRERKRAALEKVTQ